MGASVPSLKPWTANVCLSDTLVSRPRLLPVVEGTQSMRRWGVASSIWRWADEGCAPESCSCTRPAPPPQAGRYRIVANLQDGKTKGLFHRPASVFREESKGVRVYCLAAISTRRYAPLTSGLAPCDSRDDVFTPPPLSKKLSQPSRASRLRSVERQLNTSPGVAPFPHAPVATQVAPRPV